MKRGLVVWLGIAAAVLMFVGWRATRDVQEPEGNRALPSRAVAPMHREAEDRLRHLADRPSAVRGRVIAAQGLALDGAVVALHTPLPKTVAPVEPFVTTTDGDGRWSIAELPPGRYDLSVTRTGYGSTFETGLELEPGTERTGVQTVLASADDNVTGRVTDPKGNPVPKARVDVMPMADKHQSSPRITSTLTDERGEYRLAVTPGRYMMAVVHRDYTKSLYPALVFERVVRDFSLAPGGVIEGRVVDRDKGTPVEGAAVSISSVVGQGNATLAYIEKVRSNADGRFTLRGVTAGVVSVDAVGPGFASVQPTSVSVGVGEHVEEVEVLVEPALTLSGYVVFDDAESEGVPGMTVGVFARPGTMTRASAPTNAEGLFEIHGLLPGSHSLLVLGSNGVPGRISNYTIEESDISDALLRVPRGRFIRGRLEPPAEAAIHLTYQVRLAGERQAQMSTVASGLSSTMRLDTSAPDGTFTIGPIAAESFELTAVSKGGHVGRKSVDLRSGDADDLVISMQPGLEIDGRVVDESGRPIAGQSVVFHRDAEFGSVDMSTFVSAPGTLVVSDTRGEFRLVGLTPGAYSYSVIDERLIRQPWADPPSEESALAPRHMVVDRSRNDVELRIASSHTLRGRVLGPNGDAVSNARVVAWPELPPSTPVNATKDTGINKLPIPEQKNPRQWRRLPPSSVDTTRTQARAVAREVASAPVLTDAQGRFSIPGRRFGSYGVRAVGERGTLRANVHGVDPSAPLDIHLSALGSLEGTLEGGLLANGTTAIHIMGRVWSRVLVQADRQDFVVPRLSPGRYEVLAIAPGGAHKSEIEILPGQTTSGRFPLRAYATVLGRVVDVSTEQPLGVLHVTRYVSERQSFDEQENNRRDLFHFDWDDEEVVVDAKGRFELRQIIPEATTTLSFRVPSSDRVVAQLVVEPPSGQRIDVGEVRGLSRLEVPPAEQGTLGLEVRTARQEEGGSILQVSGLREGMPASTAGVRLGDRIVEIDEYSVAELGTLTSRQLLEPAILRAGDARSLVLERDTERLEIELLAVSDSDGR